MEEGRRKTEDCSAGLRTPVIYSDPIITLEDIKELIAKFSDENFGEDRPFQAPLYHLMKEVNTAMGYGDMEDFVDMQCLLLDAFRKRFPGVSTQQLIYNCKEKIEVIIPARTWKKIQSFSNSINQ